MWLVGMGIFAWPAQASYQLLHSFAATGAEGTQPLAGAVSGADGWLYGTTSAAGTNSGGTLYRMDTQGGGFVVLHAFQGGTGADGNIPSAAPLVPGDGYLYGTTTSGGTNDGGTVYRIKTDGSAFQLLHHFTGGNTDGSHPAAELTLAGDGNLYGQTQTGGTNGAGVIFRLSLDGGSFQVLHHFGAVGDGAYPISPLLAVGNTLYGATYEGGTGAGIIYRLPWDGSQYQILHTFDAETYDFEAQNPAGSLAVGADGWLYGTTSSGGMSLVMSNLLHDVGPYYNAGAIFKLTTNGSAYFKIHDFFQTTNDSAFPQASLIAGGDGRLYGTTTGGGMIGRGTIFQVATNGDVATVYSFGNSSAGTLDGKQPYAGLTLAADGTFYGTTQLGGAGNQGTVFAIDPRVQITGQQHFAVVSDHPRWGERLALAGLPGQRVTLQRSSDLAAWNDLVSQVIPDGTDGSWLMMDTNAPAGQGFYRVRSP